MTRSEELGRLSNSQTRSASSTIQVLIWVKLFGRTQSCLKLPIQAISTLVHGWRFEAQDLSPRSRFEPEFQAILVLHTKVVGVSSIQPETIEVPVHQDS